LLKDVLALPEVPALGNYDNLETVYNDLTKKKLDKVTLARKVSEKLTTSHLQAQGDLLKNVGGMVDQIAKWNEIDMNPRPTT
jgi:hypothetical protein